MTELTIRAAGRLAALRRRVRLRDDRGLETAEVLLWMGLVAGIITAISGVLSGILDGVVAQIGEALNFD